VQALSLIFRQGEVADIPHAARLAAHSFPGVGRSLPEWERAFGSGPRGGAESLWVGEEDGRPVAVCQLYRLRQWIAGVEIPLMGLGTVAIGPAHRRRGIGGQLTIQGLRHARERGDLASALYPFRTSFYRKLGYGLAGEVQQYRIPPSTLPDHPARAAVRVVESSADRASVHRLYDAWAPGQTGQLVREERAWDLVWQSGTRHGVLHSDSDGRPTGYAVFGYQADPARGGRAIDVEEIVWLDDTARRGLHGWLSSLGDQWDYVLYRAHPEEGFPEQLAELRFPDDSQPRWHFWFHAAATLYGPMFRILDLEGIFRLRSIRQGPPLTLGLRVADEQLPENSGDWTLHLADGRIETRRGPTGSADGVLEVGIEALSRIFIGALTPSAALSAHVARLHRPDLAERLDALLRVPRPWMFDRF
jgi:predicted acetyltransferase